MSVIGADGKRVGTIDLVTDAYFIVKHGVFPHDHYIPTASIASHDDDTVYLNVPTDEALERGFANPGVAYAGSEDVAVADAADEVEPAAGAVDDDRPLAGDVAVDDDDRSIEDAAVDDDRSIDEDIVVDEPREEPASVAGPDVEDHVGDDAHRTIELYEEELSVTTRPVERGVVRAAKKVVEEKVSLEVPVVEEEVIVTRRRVEGDLAGDDYVFEEGDIEIPLRGQDVEIEKQAKVVEEIDIDKTARQQTREVTETVHRETARIEGDHIDRTADADTDDANGDGTRA
jgi:uncharacterized protein (TIGR02271 family)